MAAQAKPTSNSKLIEVSKSKTSLSNSGAIKPAAAKNINSVLPIGERNLQDGYTSSSKTTIDEPKMSAQPNSAFQTDAAGNTAIVKEKTGSAPLTGSGGAGLNSFAGAATSGNTNNLNNANDHLINENNRNDKRMSPLTGRPTLRQSGR